MAGHSKFKNIMHRKGAQDAKRAKIFTKLVREIITAVRVGGIDINFNTRLRLAINNAKSLNLPKDRIDNAIIKGSSPSIGENYEELRYEGYMPGGVAVIIETLTDNRNRTASDIRSAFTKFGGNLGETSSVSFMFDKVGIIEYPTKIATEEEVFNSVIESNADNCELASNFYKITCNFNNFNEVREFLAFKYGEPESAELSWIAHNVIEIKDISQKAKLEKFLDLLEDNDDVQNIYTNHTI